MKFFNKYFYGDYESFDKGGAAQPSQSPKGEIAIAQPTLNADSTNKTTSPQSGPGAPDNPPLGGRGAGSWPLWEIFIRSKQGLDHKHVGSLHATDAYMAVENARDVYTRRQEGVSIWVVESSHIHASNPDEAESFYEPANDKVYRHPTFYNLPDELTHM